MQLYEVPRTTEGTWVRVLEDTDGPVDSPNFQANDLVLFYHVDGMYSLCKARDGSIVHLRAWTEVEVVEDGPGVPDKEKG